MLINITEMSRMFKISNIGRFLHKNPFVLIRLWWPLFYSWVLNCLEIYKRILNKLKTSSYIIDFKNVIEKLITFFQFSVLKKKEKEIYQIKITKTILKPKQMHTISYTGNPTNCARDAVVESFSVFLSHFFINVESKTETTKWL